MPKFFRKSGEGALSNYNWNDISSGTGFVTFYGCAATDSVSTTYNLLTNAVYSSVIEVTTTSAVTMNFDSAVFNLPRIVKGTAYFSVGYAISSTGTVNIQAQLQKLNGATATNISSNITTDDKTASGSTIDGMYFIKIPCTQTLIKKGEQLRLVVTLTRSSAGTAAIGLDPKNRDGAYIVPSTSTDAETIMTLFVPFRIDL